MTIQYLEYTGLNTARGLSPSIWHDCPRGQLMEDNTEGVFLMDNFAGVAIDLTGGFLWTPNGVYDYFATAAGPSVVASTANLHGGALFDGVDADNDEIIVTDMASYMTSTTAAENFKLWFEAQVTITTAIADQGLFIGLGPPSGASAASILTADDAAPVDKDLIGFHADTAAPTAVDAIHSNLGDAVDHVVASAGVDVLTLNESVKYGIKWDPHADVDGKLLQYFINGVEVASLDAADAALVTFPNSEPLGRCICLKTGEAVEKNLILDWWAISQLRRTDG